MLQNKTKKDSKQKRDLETEVSDKKNTPAKSNKLLLWTILISLSVLLVLLMMLIAFNFGQEQLQKRLAGDSSETVEIIQEQEEVPFENIQEDETPEVINNLVENKEQNLENEKQGNSSEQAEEKDLEENSSVEEEQEKANPESKEKAGCEAKDFDGKEYADGKSYTDFKKCKVCTCDDGDWKCKDAGDDCVVLGDDCVEDGVKYHDGETRVDRDRMHCQLNCKCNNGKWDCELAPGATCCIDSRGNVYDTGQKFFDNWDDKTDPGCSRCICNKGYIVCSKIPCIDPMHPSNPGNE